MRHSPWGSETNLVDFMKQGWTFSPPLLSESPNLLWVWMRFPQVRVSSSFSAPGSSSQSSRTRVVPLTDKAALVEQSMVLRDNNSARRLALGDTGKEGPSIASVGDNISSPALTPEGTNWGTLGFPLKLLRPFSEQGLLPLEEFMPKKGCLWRVVYYMWCRSSQLTDCFSSGLSGGDIIFRHMPRRVM